VIAITTRVIAPTRMTASDRRTTGERDNVFPHMRWDLPNKLAGGWAALDREALEECKQRPRVCRGRFDDGDAQP
jgi:hypothetical protein